MPTVETPARMLAQLPSPGWTVVWAVVALGVIVGAVLVLVALSNRRKWNVDGSDDARRERRAARDRRRHERKARRRMRRGGLP